MMADKHWWCKDKMEAADTVGLVMAQMIVLIL